MADLRIYSSPTLSQTSSPQPAAIDFTDPSADTPLPVPSTSRSAHTSSSRSGSSSSSQSRSLSAVPLAVLLNSSRGRRRRAAWSDNDGEPSEGTSIKTRQKRRRVSSADAGISYPLMYSGPSAGPSSEAASGANLAQALPHGGIDSTRSSASSPMPDDDEIVVVDNLTGAGSSNALPSGDYISVDDENEDDIQAVAGPSSNRIMVSGVEASSSSKGSYTSTSSSTSAAQPSSSTLPVASTSTHTPPPVQPSPEPLSTYTCPICFSPPTYATLTPCGHVCCGACLFAAVKAGLQRAAMMGTGGEAVLPRCPVCRASIPDWDGRGGGVIGLKTRTVLTL